MKSYSLSLSLSLSLSPEISVLYVKLKRWKDKFNVALET